MYPFKALHGADVPGAPLVARGALRLDRAFALVEAGGEFVNGKRAPRVHELRVRYDPGLTQATFSSPRLRAGCRFVFGDDPASLEAWLTGHFERPVVVRRDDDGGFPDDTQAPGPTIVSSATLATVASWFPGLDASSVRGRLRANVEVDGVPAFWEDGLYGAAGTAVALTVNTRPAPGQAGRTIRVGDALGTQIPTPGEVNSAR